jgi:hypothetical protein
VLWQFQQAATKGSSLSERQLLNLGLSAQQWQRIRASLLDNCILTLTQQGGLVLCYDLSLLSLQDLASLLKIEGYFPDDGQKIPQLPWGEPLLQRFKSIDAYTQQQLDVSLAAIFCRATVDGPEVALHKGIAPDTTNYRAVCFWLQGRDCVNGSKRAVFSGSKRAAKKTRFTNLCLYSQRPCFLTPIQYL